MSTSITSTFAGRTTAPSSASAVLSSPGKQIRSQSDASNQTEVTATTSGSVSSAEAERYHNGMDSPGEKKVQSPPYTCHKTGDSNPVMKRRKSGSLPDLSKSEEEEDITTFDMSDFGSGDFYQTSDLRTSERKPLPDVPEEATDIISPPSSLGDPSLMYPAHAMNIFSSPPSRGISPAMGPSSMASSTSTVHSMELHTTQPILYSAIGSLEKIPNTRSIVKSSGREFRSMEPLLLPPSRTQKSSKTNPTDGISGKPVPRTKRQGGKTTQSDRPTKSVLRKTKTDTKDPAQQKVKVTEPKRQRKKGKRVTINQQAEERFLPVSEAFTPREKKNIKYKPAEMRTPVQKIGMGTLARPNFRDALRRVAMIIRQHIVKIEHRFESAVPGDAGAGLFDPAMKDLFSDEQFVTPRYKCTMVRVPMARPGTVYGLRKIRLDFSIPTEEEIYEFGHQLFNSVQLSSECSIVCLIYVERLMEVAKVPLLASTWRPIFMCGLLLASKVWQDLASWNIEFASVYPQYSLDAINRLELNFLRMVKWDLYISSRYVMLVSI